MFKKVKVGFLL